MSLAILNCKIRIFGDAITDALNKRLGAIRCGRSYQVDRGWRRGNDRRPDVGLLARIGSATHQNDGRKTLRTHSNCLLLWWFGPGDLLYNFNKNIFQDMMRTSTIHMIAHVLLLQGGSGGYRCCYWPCYCCCVSYVLVAITIAAHHQCHHHQCQIRRHMSIRNSVSWTKIGVRTLVK